MALGDKDGALATYAEMSARYGKDFAATDWLTFGVLLSEKSRLAEALRAFEKAVQIAPQDPRAWYNLARTSQLQGDFKAARDALQKSAAIAPGDVKAWMAKDPAFGGLPSDTGGNRSPAQP